MRKILALAAILLLAPSASATKLRKVSVPEVYQGSDLVLFGTIQSGRVLPDDCGVEYVARVRTAFKGKIHTGSLIKFRTGRVTQVGSDYFLFLSTLKNEFSAVTSTTTSSNIAAVQSQHIQRCRLIWPLFVVNASDHAGLQTTGSQRSSNRAVLFDNRILVPPKELGPIQLGPYDKYIYGANATALDFRQFMSYLKSLPSAK